MQNGEPANTHAATTNANVISSNTAAWTAGFADVEKYLFHNEQHPEG